jgi:hypothetical protein
MHLLNYEPIEHQLESVAPAEQQNSNVSQGVDDAKMLTMTGKLMQDCSQHATSHKL